MAGTSGVLRLPTASIHYETSGSGDLLILVPGVSGTGVIFSELARYLSSGYRVTTYDRRGFTQKTMVDVEENVGPDDVLALNAQDTCALIEHLSPSFPAIIFGSSEGALIAVEILYANPALLKEVILHEPVMLSLVPPPKRKILTAKYFELQDAFKKHGTAAATPIFLSMVTDTNERKLMKSSPVSLKAAASMGASMTYFFENEIEAIFRWKFNPYQLKGVNVPVHLIKGAQSTLDFTATPILALSALLSLPVSEVAGGHLGYVTHTEDFANRIKGLLRGGKASL
ncbi:alpha/beta-hydrolase [Penicillium canescens]|nr:alpha/beta-hydrolase [Penicillium canescens]KAJ6182929.1 alpha/beta-hydrolase [Penicillium canescens]